MFIYFPQTTLSCLLHMGQSPDYGICHCNAKWLLYIKLFHMNIPHHIYYPTKLLGMIKLYSSFGFHRDYRQNNGLLNIHKQHLYNQCSQRYQKKMQKSRRGHWKSKVYKSVKLAIILVWLISMVLWFVYNFTFCFDSASHHKHFIKTLLNILFVAV